MACFEIYHPHEMPRNPGRRFADPHFDDHLDATYRLVHEESIDEVMVPDEDGSYTELAEEIYTNHNSPRRPNASVYRSLSVGDLIRFTGDDTRDELQLLIVLPCGFRQLTQTERDTITLERRDVLLPWANTHEEL